VAKLKSGAITISDLKDYLGTHSDFAFELRVLEMLKRFGLECEHGGHYEDPVTKKSREFDIRASGNYEKARVRLAIECKNIRENFPILVSCVPRHEHESYHQVAIMSEPSSTVNGVRLSSLHVPRSDSISIRGDYSLYKAGELVGKSTSQVGRATDNSIVANDVELYEKWGQCLGSAHGLVERMYWDDDGPEMFGCVIPCVIVPDGRLWGVAYNIDGTQIGVPEPMDRCSCYADKAFRMGTDLAIDTYWISHVEIMTFSGLERFVMEHLQDVDGYCKIFSPDGINGAFDRRRES